ncbi:MAG: replication initiation protein [Roseburia sp.]
MDNQNNTNNNELILRKSNSLISGKYKTSLLENKLMAIALTRIEIVDNCPMARLFPGEIKQILGKTNDTNIYKTLKKTAKVMTGHQLVVEDGKGNFKAFSMINNADYINGEFTITFNKNMTPHVHDLKANFTTMELATLMKFQYNYSYRIYELLKKEVYRIDPEVDNGVIQKEYGINELRCMIGLVNMDEEGVKRAVAANKSWDEIYENIAIEKQFPVWYDFRRKVLDVAQKELKEKSDIKFDYTVERYGRGAKIRRICFYISENDPDIAIVESVKNTASIIKLKNKEYTQMNFEDYNEEFPLQEYIGHNGLDQDDLEGFLKVAAGDVEKVKNAIELSDEQPEIRNLVGWIRTCITEGYKKPVATINGSSEQAERVQAIQEKKEENKDIIALKVWEKIQKKSEYATFLEYMAQQKGIKKDVLEMVFDVDERIDYFTNWKKEHK